MALLGWRNKLYASALVLALYLTISAIFSIGHIQQGKLSKQNPQPGANGASAESGASAPQPRNLASVAHSSPMRMTPRRLRSRMGPAIEWCLPLKYRKNPGPVVALASFPGSGNTWLRYLLQQATGLLTGSVYKDYALLKNGFPAENVVNGSVIAVKNHEFGPETIKTFGKVILLVRNPFDSLRAEFNRRSGGHVGHAPAEKYSRNNGKYWKTFVHSKADEWVKMNLAWHDGFPPQDRLVVLYDDLVSKTEEELKKVLRFLGVTIDSEVLKCAMNRKEGIYKRSKRPINFEIFDPKMKDLLNDRMATLYNILNLPLTWTTRAPTKASVTSSSLAESEKNFSTESSLSAFVFDKKTPPASIQSQRSKTL